MPDSKITALTAITTVNPATFPLVIVDTSDTSMATTGTTKKVTTNQLLGSGGTATLASATITGDLTVDTSTLKVDSANNRVGIVNASPSFALDVNGAGSGVSARISSGSGTGFRFDTTRNVGGLNRNYLIGCDVLNEGWFSIVPSTALGGGTFTNSIYNASYDGTHTWSDGAGGERMRLNSTGLGVGTASPSYSIQSYGTAPAIATGGTTTMSAAGQIGASFVLRSESTSVWTGTREMVSFDSIGNGADHRIGGLSIKLKATSGASSLTEYLQINPTYGYTILQQGNLGIGVTPSAWWSSTKALQFGLGGSISGRTDTGARSYFASNAFLNSSPAWTYVTTNFATRYEQNDGTHQWHTAPSGTAGNAITFTQAMTLDASSNLLVATTNASFGTANGFRTGDTGGRLELGSASSTNANIGFDMYSTGAAAYRFYVGWGGTVFATNTTISAISDARLKENVQDIDVGLGAILALKPRKFDWKAGKGKDIKGDRGFIAQEFEQVFPNLIDEWKDAAPEGEAPYKSVRQDLIPVLVKAIQELTARVQTLETR